MISEQCMICKHFWGKHCDAFPETSIPEEILNGSFNHEKPHKGDNGIQFEPLEKESA